MSLRTDLAAYLADVCEATTGLEDVRVMPSVRDVGALSKPALIVKTNALEKLPQAPRSQYVGSFTLTLVSPHQDIDKAEDDLEARLWQHVNGYFPTCYTATRLPVKLVWCEEMPTRYEALEAERRIKGWSRAKKEALILGRELEKLERNLGGIRGMSRRPDAVFVIEPVSTSLSCTT